MSDQPPASPQAANPLNAPAARAPAVPPLNTPREDRTGLAIMIMCAVAMIFAVQDGLSRQLGSQYPAIFIVMLRFWFFALFVIVLVARQPGGLGRAMRSKHPWMQIFRGVLLVAEVVIMVESFVRLGLVETHAIFTASPLLVAALSGPILGEKVGWRRWTAIMIGFLGILIVLNPGQGMFAPAAILPLIAALMFAVYGLATRYVSRQDSSLVSFFWTGISGAAAITLVGIWQWVWLAPLDWFWMLCLCITAIAGHYLLIRAYELAEASALQPFAYTQLVWASVIGVIFFGDVVKTNVVIGAAVVVGAGLFTLWRERQKARARVR
ncbi:DMT family transporter [uncultured Paracoccus sp.]|uniref:DMT family transporter n=1 Tax=uncultured Paracoccus sp. TaxID=189685 RepID=UPI0026322F34|nr:DMT family transporter [uncultured Paracoccus sp.]